MPKTQSGNAPPSSVVSKVSPVWEDYLSILYSMTSERVPAIAARIAERLGVATSGVSGHLRRMERAGLVRFGLRRHIVLTEPGHLLAISVMRRHHLVECWLFDALGVDWADVHDEADQLEHSISPVVEERLMDALGHPTNCPHGNTIPGDWGRASSETYVVDQPVDHTTDGAHAVVERVSEEGEHDRAFLRSLETHGIRPGAHIRIESTDLLAGTVTIASGGRTLVLEIQKAVNIRVRPTSLKQVEAR